MDIRLKQRIIGAVVIVALIVVVIAIFLAHKTNREDALKLSAQIPKAPSKPSASFTAAESNITTTSKTTTTVMPVSATINTNPGSTQLALPKLTAATATAASESSTSADTDTVTTDSLPTPPTQPIVITSNQQKPPVTAAISHKTKKSTAKLTKKTPATNEKISKHTNPKVALHTSGQKHKITKSPAPLAEAWTVQLGSFSDKINAQKLVHKLRAKGFTAYLHETKTKKGNIIHVYVGPEIRHAEAKKLAQRLQKSFKLTGMVVKYKL